MSCLSVCCSFEDPSRLQHRGIIWSDKCPLDRGEDPSPLHDCYFNGEACPHCRYVGTWGGHLMIKCDYEEDNDRTESEGYGHSSEPSISMLLGDIDVGTVKPLDEQELELN